MQCALKCNGLTPHRSPFYWLLLSKPHQTGTPIATPDGMEFSFLSFGLFFPDLYWNVTNATVLAVRQAWGAAELHDGGAIANRPEPGLDDILEKGIKRLLEKATWKLWQWPPEEKVFFNADSFR